MKILTSLSSLWRRLRQSPAMSPAERTRVCGMLRTLAKRLQAMGMSPKAVRTLIRIIQLIRLILRLIPALNPQEAPKEPDPEIIPPATEATEAS